MISFSCGKLFQTTMPLIEVFSHGQFKATLSNVMQYIALGTTTFG
jgi:hypothetical protein